MAGNLSIDFESLIVYFWEGSKVEYGREATRGLDWRLAGWHSSEPWAKHSVDEGAYVPPLG